MGTFTFVTYSGPDAGKVLVNMLADGVSTDDEETHELESQTERHIGFMPNPEPEDDEEGDEDDGEPDPD